MRRIFVIISLIIGIGYVVLAQERRSYDESKCIYFNYQNQKYSICYFDYDLDKTPTWLPDRAEPPISLRSAIEKSRGFLAKHVEDPQAWQIVEIHLDRVGEKNKWVYEIEFECSEKNCGGNLPLSYRAVLKMDGSFIDPQISKE